jgi:hypothetical protein
VPDHEELLPRWAGYLAPGGWLAFQLPGNFDEPSHAVLRDLAGSDRWRDRLAGVELNRQVLAVLARRKPASSSGSTGSGSGQPTRPHRTAPSCRSAESSRWRT